MMVNIRTDVLLMAWQMTTGVKSKSVIKINNNALAVILIIEPEYMYTFASVEIE
jgi:hypothetical protein